MSSRDVDVILLFIGFRCYKYSNNLNLKEIQMSKKKKYTADVVENDIIEDAVIEEVVDAVEEVVVEEVEVEKPSIIEKAIKKVKEKVAPKETPAPIASTVKPAHTYDAWWNEVGGRLIKKGYSKNGTVKRAIQAFGPEFNKDKYDAVAKADSAEEMVKAVWTSQK